MAKKRISFFISYARANKELANRFLVKFQEQLTPSKNFEYKFWKDNEIKVGEKWHEEINRAIDNCRLGLFLVSPAFLGSQFIKKHELPKFIKSKSKAIIPIMLQPIDFERHDLKGLEKLQIFRLEGKHFQSPKAYGDCIGNQRERFVQELFKQVEDRMEKIL
jgi:hypothetical protein